MLIRLLVGVVTSIFEMPLVPTHSSVFHKHVEASFAKWLSGPWADSPRHFHAYAIGTSGS
jgi:hypothetical protein